MDERILEDQRELIELIEDAGWTVTDAELSEYDSPWEDDTPEATVTLTARRPYPDEGGDGDGEDDNPYRVQ